MADAPKQFGEKRHKPRKKHQKKRVDNKRGNSHSRGYDKNWKKLRNWYIKISPLCEHCEKSGKVTSAEEIDHIIPFDGIDDPLRLDRSNLQSLCRSCHRRKTNREQWDDKIDRGTYSGRDL